MKLKLYEKLKAITNENEFEKNWKDFEARIINQIRGAKRAVEKNDTIDGNTILLNAVSIILEAVDVGDEAVAVYNNEREPLTRKENINELFSSFFHPALVACDFIDKTKLDVKLLHEEIKHEIDAANAKIKEDAATLEAINDTNANLFAMTNELKENAGRLEEKEKIVKELESLNNMERVSINEIKQLGDEVDKMVRTIDTNRIIISNLDEDKIARKNELEQQDFEVCKKKDECRDIEAKLLSKEAEIKTIVNFIEALTQELDEKTIEYETQNQNLESAHAIMSDSHNILKQQSKENRKILDKMKENGTCPAHAYSRIENIDKELSLIEEDLTEALNRLNQNRSVATM